MRERTILHCDMNNYFASVELLDHPELRGLPMAVCGNPEHRHGIILAKSQEAKVMGVKTATTIWQAKKLCPDLVCVKPHMDKYKYYSGLINEIYQRYTDMVEPFSIDESWLDVTASLKLFGSGEKIANEIRETVKKELGLTLSCGVSYNKIFAKMGSEYKKPDATTVISKDNFKELLWPMNVGEMFFVGRASAEKLTTYGIQTIGDLATADPKMLEDLLGKQGIMLNKYANGLDDSPVSLYCEKRKIKSVGNGTTFRRNLMGKDDVRTAVIALSDKIAARLRKYQLKAWGVKVDIKDPSLKVVSRQKQLSAATNVAEEIAKIAYNIIEENKYLTRPIRLLTITGINLCDEDESSMQLGMFQESPEERDKNEKLDRAMDKIREKYGSGSISFARLINEDLGLFPDIEIEEDD